MNRISRILPLILISTAISVLGQNRDSILFRSETLNLKVQEEDTCVQVGLFVSYRGPEERSWSVLNATLNYKASHGLLLGAPSAKSLSFENSDPGLTNPATNHLNSLDESSPCKDLSTANSVSLRDSSRIYFVSGEGNATSSEKINSMTGRIEIVASSPGILFKSPPGQEFLFAVLTFPLSAGVPGTIDLQFVPDSLVRQGNSVVDQKGSTLTAYFIDGSVNVESRWPRLSLTGLGILLFISGTALSVAYHIWEKGGKRVQWLIPS